MTPLNTADANVQTDLVIKCRKLYFRDGQIEYTGALWSLERLATALLAEHHVVANTRIREYEMTPYCSARIHGDINRATGQIDLRPAS